MNVLYLSACSQLGGAERALLDMLASIRESDPACRLHVITSERGPLVSECNALGVHPTVIELPKSLAALGDSALNMSGDGRLVRCATVAKVLFAVPAVVSYLLRLRRAIHAIAPDVIHSNGFKMHVLGALARPRRIPLVWHIHDFVSTRRVMAKSLQALSRLAAAAIANSEAVASNARAVFGDHLPVRTIYNAVDLNRFSGSGNTVDLDQLAGFQTAAGGSVKVGLLGTLARWKGHETFLRALSLLPNDLPVRAYVIGDALYRTEGSQHSLDELKTLARRLGVRRRVAFTGFVTEPAAALRALDIVVHASTQPEPFGLVIAEAAACGKSIIATEQAGATELMTNRKDFIAQRAGDAAGLAAQIQLLTRDANLRKTLGSNARAIAERHFDRTRLAVELMPIYRGVRGGLSGDVSTDIAIGELRTATSDI